MRRIYFFYLFEYTFKIFQKILFNFISFYSHFKIVYTNVTANNNKWWISDIFSFRMPKLKLKFSKRIEFYPNWQPLSQYLTIPLNFCLNMCLHNTFNILLNEYEKPSQFSQQITISIPIIHFKPALRLLEKLLSNHISYTTNNLFIKKMEKVTNHKHVVCYESILNE